MGEATSALEFRSSAAPAYQPGVQGKDLGVMRLYRARALAGRLGAATDAYRGEAATEIGIIFQLTGCTRLERRDSSIVLRPGEWSTCGSPGRGRMLNLEPVEVLILLVPRRRLDERTLEALTRLRQPCAETDLGRVIRKFMLSLLDDLPTPSLTIGASLGDAVIDWIRLAMLEHAQVRRNTSATELMRERIKAYVRRHLHDPGLSIDAIATAMNCSKRYLHKIFPADGHETLAHHIWNLRLQRCREDLLSPQCAIKSITEIALSWGFNNSAHFSRSFRQRYGATPSKYRHRVGALPHPALPLSGNSLPA